MLTYNGVNKEGFARDAALLVERIFFSHLNDNEIDEAARELAGVYRIPYTDIWDYLPHLNGTEETVTVDINGHAVTYGRL